MAQVALQDCMLLLSPSVITAGAAYILAAVMFAFGFCILLFCLAIYLLLKIPAVMNRQLHLFWLILLFVLSSMSAAVRTAYIISQKRSGKLLSAQCVDDTFLYNLERRAVGLQIVCHSLFVSVNCLSDFIMIYRLFVIWGRRRHITILPTMVALLLFFLGIAATIMTAVSQVNLSVNEELADLPSTVGLVYDSTNAAFNFLLTLTLAGRIWWINHKAHAILSPALQQKYRAVITILLESGVLYPPTLIAHVVVYIIYRRNDYSPYLIDIASLAYQMAARPVF
uniref:Uncharacterized protein n=1 Tax=Moniliophthora roreri TaxID=221103 RepID=A0A0W0GFN5_MONRR